MTKIVLGSRVGIGSTGGSIDRGSIGVVLTEIVLKNIVLGVVMTEDVPEGSIDRGSTWGVLLAEVVPGGVVLTEVVSWKYY